MARPPGPPTPQGAPLRELRLRAELSLLELAERVAELAPGLEGRSHTALGRLETQDSTAHGLAQLREFVEALAQLGVGPRASLEAVTLLSNPSAAWAAQVLALAEVYQVDPGVLLGLEGLPPASS